MKQAIVSTLAIFGCTGFLLDLNVIDSLSLICRHKYIIMYHNSPLPIRSLKKNPIWGKKHSYLMLFDTLLVQILQREVANRRAITVGP